MKRVIALVGTLVMALGMVTLSSTSAQAYTSWVERQCNGFVNGTRYVCAEAHYHGQADGVGIVVTSIKLYAVQCNQFGDENHPNFAAIGRGLKLLNYHSEIKWSAPGYLDKSDNCTSVYSGEQSGIPHRFGHAPAKLVWTFVPQLKGYTDHESYIHLTLCKKSNCPT